MALIVAVEGLGHDGVREREEGRVAAPLLAQRQVALQVLVVQHGLDAFPRDIPGPITAASLYPWVLFVRWEQSKRLAREFLAICRPMQVLRCIVGMLMSVDVVKTCAECCCLAQMCKMAWQHLAGLASMEWSWRVYLLAAPYMESEMVMS